MNKKYMIIGGSGALSGALARLAIEQNAQVWTLTRGVRELPAGVNPLTCDRNDPEAFREAVLGTGEQFDAVFDCIAMNRAHALMDLEVLPYVTKRLVVVSTDSVYDPRYKKTPQTEEGIFLDTSDESVRDYATEKRRMEEAFLEVMQKPMGAMSVTIFRPGHIYGPGMLPGCFPEHSRQADLAAVILRDHEVSLVGGGHFLIHPVFAEDLAKTMLSSAEQEGTKNRIFCVGGPEAFENRLYYETYAELLGVTDLTIREIRLTGYTKAHPEYAAHLCHRIYDLSALAATGTYMPSTPLREGLRRMLFPEETYRGSDEFMQAAITEARIGIYSGHGGPFGCVIVKDGQVVGAGHNMVLANHDSTAHGEIVAIRNAEAKLGTHDLSGCTLYTTGEPCHMCLTAILWANIKQVYYGCTIRDNALIGFRDEAFDDLFSGRDKLDPLMEMKELDREACLKLFEEYLTTNPGNY